MAKFKKTANKKTAGSRASADDVQAQAEKLSKTLSESAQQIWLAGVGAFGRAMNRIYEIEEGRPVWKLRPTNLLVTLVTLLLCAAAMPLHVLIDRGTVYIETADRETIAVEAKLRVYPEGAATRDHAQAVGTSAIDTEERAGAYLVRTQSPPPGRSTLITSAPSSARMAPQ